MCSYKTQTTEEVIREAFKRQQSLQKAWAMQCARMKPCKYFISSIYTNSHRKERTAVAAFMLTPSVSLTEQMSSHTEHMRLDQINEMS